MSMSIMRKDWIATFTFKDTVMLLNELLNKQLFVL